MFEVLNYIHENIKEQLNISDVATHFGYSKWHFCRKFHDFKKMTFNEYVRHYRMQLACIDILNGEKVSDVAFKYGYDTVGGFNKAFLKEYGCLSREYKKQAKESQLYYERRRSSMYRLSDRCAELRNDAVNTKSNMENYCYQRFVYFTLGAQESGKKGDPFVVQVSKGIANTLDKFTPFIAPGELICGFNFSDGPISDIAEPKNTPEDIAIMKKNGISDDDIKAFLEIDPTYKDFKYIYGLDLTCEDEYVFSKEEREASKEWAAMGRCICSNHSVIGYEDVLKLGFSGLYEKVCRYEKINGRSDMYDGMKEICLCAKNMGEKYALCAKKLLEDNDPRYNREDLEMIVKVCSNVPKNPAQSFAQAVQTLWFAHIINTWEDTINANSIGRLDHILYPYYKADIEKGILTPEQAFEIICCLWIKLYRDYDVQQSCVGGTKPDGSDDINELSYMMLDATESLDFIRCLSVRYSEKTNKEFIKRALEVVGHVQKGVPFFFNDDVMIPALLYKNIKKEDAYNYTQLGCVETVIPGMCNPHAVTGETNFLKAIEYVLCNGHSLMYPELFPGEATGELESFDSYEKFYSAVIAQVDRILNLTCRQVVERCGKCIAPKPYKSLLTRGCLESGKDINEKGAIYDYYQIMLGGIPNLADSLMVIKKFVYTDKKYTLSQLKSILENNFPDESVRQEFINKSSKFGNDIDEVDSIAVDIVEHCCDLLEELSEKYGYSFHAQPFTFLWMIDHGEHSAASADGRRKGEPIAYSVSPMQGRDFNGLGAVLNSIAKFPTKRTPGTTSAIVEVDPKLFTDKNIDILADILIAASKKGLSNVQFNTIDADTLVEAKKYPDKYNNLAVRVSGFSQKFNLLTPELQDHIIGRTKHSCL